MMHCLVQPPDTNEQVARAPREPAEKAALYSVQQPLFAAIIGSEVWAAITLAREPVVALRMKVTAARFERIVTNHFACRPWL